MNKVTIVPKLLLATVLTMLCYGTVAAQPGTRTVVQTVTFNSAQEGYYIFPDTSKHYEKILMHYKLRCPYDGPCGEWDYLMYIHLFDHTGKIDSVSDTAVSYQVEGASPATFRYMKTPSWKYFPSFSSKVVYGDTSAFSTALVGADTADLPLAAGTSPTRMQFFWRKSELTAAGLQPGAITGLRLNLKAPAGDLKNLTIRIKGTTLDTLPSEIPDISGFTVAYAHDTRMNAAGWIPLSFQTPFDWNGTSSLIVDVSYDAATSQVDLLGDAPTFSAAIGTTEPEPTRHFEGADYIDVPARAFATVDSMVTISFWQYGNPIYQPQNQSIFEGVDEFGRRVLNMHLPWSDGTVYWDAGSGNYDRDSKPADSSLWEGTWTHWTVTKNTVTGQMRIYLNGKSWAAVANKRKNMAGIRRFRLGSAGDGTSNYDGRIDEFAVWDTELDRATIAKLPNLGPSEMDAYRDRLRVYYKFDESSLEIAVDSSGNSFDGTLTGPPAGRSTPASELHTGLIRMAIRPQMTFEQGTFTSHLDSTFVIDSVMNDPVQVVFYDDPANPLDTSDIIVVWPAYYRYTFDEKGMPVDSSLVTPDSMLTLVRTPYFRKFEVVNRYELGRYITPYGNGLTLGDGFTWTYDVTDFRPLLHDTVHLAAYNQQELVDLSFEFIEGTPPRDPIRIDNLWVGSPSYGTSTPIETFLTPKRVRIDPAAANTKIRMTTTGHGFGGTDNCSEFCPRIHTIKVNEKEFDTLVWKENCGLNPVYPQGGTWVYNRSNWCPGDDVPVYEFETTPYVTPGDSATLDYDIQDYTWNGEGSTPYYRIETQLVSYSAPNFTHDAELVQIKSPSMTDDFRRMNPICNNPIITIRNTGGAPLTSLRIAYGIVGAPEAVYEWKGELGFLQSTDVELGQFVWSDTGRTFRVTVSDPDGEEDEYAYNDTKETAFTAPPVYPSSLVFELKTNNDGSETSYELRDDMGNVVHSRTNLESSTLYLDTLNLPDGCYEFRLLDVGGDGLEWWANPPAGSGYMRIRDAAKNRNIVAFNPDFGSEIYQQFSVGTLISGVQEPEKSNSAVSIYPNPTSGEVNIELHLGHKERTTITVADVLGKVLRERTVDDYDSGTIVLDLDDLSSGTYVVTVRAGAETFSRKVMRR